MWNGSGIFWLPEYLKLPERSETLFPILKNYIPPLWCSANRTEMITSSKVIRYTIRVVRVWCMQASSGLHKTEAFGADTPGRDVDLVKCLFHGVHHRFRTADKILE